MKIWIWYPLLSLVGLYVTCGLAGTVGVLYEAETAQDDAEARLPAAEREADLVREEVRASMQSARPEVPSPSEDPRPLGAPSYAWRELHCEIRSINSGWIAVDFEQVCDLVDVDLYPTSLRPAEGLSDTGGEWSVEPIATAAFSESDPPTGTLGRCGHVPTAHILPDVAKWPNYPGLTLRQSPATIGVYLATGEQLQADSRSVQSCPTGIVTSAQPKNSVSLSGRRPQRLAPDSSWVVVRRTDEVSRSQLGCSPWLVVFCLSPLPGPWMPDL